MRTILLTLCIAVLIIACNQSPTTSSVINVPNDLTQENLKGKITQIETDSYIIDSTGKTGALDEKEIDKFDDSGYEPLYIDMNGKDSIKLKQMIKRNANGFPTSIEAIGAKNEKKSAMTFEYDSTGKYKIAKSYDSTGKMDIYYTNITSNKYGLVTGGKGYHADSSLKLTFASSYDSIFYVGGITKDSVGKVIYSGKVKLNDKKDVAESNSTTVTPNPKTKKDSTATTIVSYTYKDWDNNGNWTQRITMDEKGKPNKLVKRIITYKQ